MESGSWSRRGVQATGTAAAIPAGLLTAAVLAVLLTVAILAVLLTAAVCRAAPGAISAPMSTRLESVASELQIGLVGVMPPGGQMKPTQSRGAGSGLSSGPDPAPGTAGGSAADRGDTNTTWLSEEAAADSLAAFWDDLDHRWLGPSDPQMPSFGLDDATLDSLVTASDQHLDKLARGDYTRFSFNPVGRMAFNRVQGPVIGVSVAWDMAVAVRSRLEIGAGYGFSNRTGVWDVKLDVPLVTRRRELPRGLGRGRPYRWLALQFSAYRKARMFAGDGRKIRYLTSLLYGSDPNQYYDVVGGYARLIWRPAAWLRVRGGIEQEEHRSLTVSTDWNLIGRSLHPPDNVPADPLRTKGVTAGLSFDAGWLDGSVDVRWNDLDYSSLATDRPGAPGIWRTRARLGVDLLDQHGNRYLLQGHYSGADRRAPAQWKTYLGDYGTLRGYPHMALSGDEGAWAALDVRWGFDLWRSLHVPGLRGLGLQTITFLDWGRTWADAESAQDPGEQGWRMDAGVGIGKFVGVPGQSGNLRLYVAHQILDGQREQGWRVLLAFEK